MTNSRGRWVLVLGCLVLVLAGFAAMYVRDLSTGADNTRQDATIAQLQAGLEVANVRLSRAGEQPVEVPPVPAPDTPAAATIVIDGPPGDTGPRGLPGDTGPRGLPGRTGAPGSVGATGAPGAPGDTGPGGDPGSVGATGAPGADGALGAPGVDGPVGPAGPTGADGAPGATGAPGADGRGIRALTCTEAGVLTVTYTDDTSTEVGACTPTQPATLRGARK